MEALAEHVEQDEAQAAGEPLFPPPIQLFPLEAPAIFIVELHREHRAIPSREWEVSAGNYKFSRAGTFFSIPKESYGENSSVRCALLCWASLSQCWFMESLLKAVGRTEMPGLVSVVACGRVSVQSLPVHLNPLLLF